MKVWVCYVTHENNLGTYVLGVRREDGAAKQLAQVHWDHGDPDRSDLVWSTYRDNGSQTHGFQSINEAQNLTYYVESTELDFEVDGKVDRRVLELEARLGELARSVQEHMGMWKPLEERQIELEGHIDYLLQCLVDAKVIEEAVGYTFPNGEVWGKGEKV